MTHGWRKLALSILIAVFLAACGKYPIDPTLPVPSPEDPFPTLSNSRLSVLVRTSWPELRSLADSAIPRCGGNPQDACLGTEESGNFIVQRENAWEVIGSIGGKDVGFKGSAWRWDPLGLSFADSAITGSLHMLYHAKIGFTQFGGFASCGYNQPAREVYATLKAITQILPQWAVKFEVATEVSPVNLCRLTLANIDVTNLLAKVANKALKKAADKSAASLARKMDFHERASKAWKQLNEPVQLGDNTWLTIRPQKAFVGSLNLSADGQFLQMPVAIEASPKIYIGNPAEHQPTDLPDLSVGPLDPTFSVYLRGAVDYATISQRLSDELVGREYRLGRFWPKSLMKFHITGVEAFSRGSSLVVAVRVAGTLDGTLYLIGEPRFIPAEAAPGGVIRFDRVDYTAETKNLLARLVDPIFHSAIRKQIQASAHWDVSGQLRKAGSSLSVAMNREIAEGVKLSGELTDFGPGEIRTGSKGIEAYYKVGGQLRLDLSSP